MKVFISSLISGMEAERAAARRVIEALRHEVLVAEDFGARPSSPQVACLGAVRASDLVVLILGARYGAVQPSGISATHEEYREAQERKPVIALVQRGDREPAQTAFVDEAGTWEQGHFRAEFSDTEELRDALTRALHDYALAHASAPLDAERLGARAVEMLGRGREREASNIALHLAVSAGPLATQLRPSEIESAGLSEALQQLALFGPTAIFERARGTQSQVHGDAISISQEHSHGDRAEARLWGTGDVRLILPLGRESRSMSFPVVIEEDVERAIQVGLAYAAEVLRHIDRTERVSHVGISAALVGRGAMGWRTEAEQRANPSSGTFDGFGMEDRREQPVQMSPAVRTRAALAMDSMNISEDLMVLLRQRWKFNSY